MSLSSSISALAEPGLPRDSLITSGSPGSVLIRVLRRGVLRITLIVL